MGDGDVMEVETEAKPSWIDPIKRFMESEKFPDDRKEARMVKYHNVYFCLVDSVLYRIGYTMSYLKYFGHEDANYILNEIHEGIYGSQAAGKSIAYIALR